MNNNALSLAQQMVWQEGGVFYAQIKLLPFCQPIIVVLHGVLNFQQAVQAWKMLQFPQTDLPSPTEA